MQSLDKILSRFVGAAENPAHEYKKTGIAGLDNTFGGGLPEGLHIFAGAPGAGKTSLAVQIANNVARNGSETLIFELEMGLEYITSRCVSQAAYFDDPSNPSNPYACRLAYPNKAEPFTEETLDRIRRGAEIFGEYADRVFVDAETPNVSGIWAKVDEYVKSRGTHPLVVVDHLRCLRVDGVSDTYEAEKVAVETLKNMSVSCGVPVILIATLNKEGLKGGSAAASVRGSVDILYYADTVTVLTPDDNGVVSARTIKNRNGSCGSTSMLFDGGYGVFRDTSKPDESDDDRDSDYMPESEARDFLAEFLKGGSRK